ncbi:MAG: Ig-like domain-containing protein, partial [Parasporobacterium sp.]|nr:Ig-like domain-containing protein [Parasporobacterium sp.]
VIVGGLDQIAKDESTSDSDVNVKMTVQKKEESDLTGTAKEEMQEIKEVVGTDEGNTELEYLDISMIKIVTKTVNSSSSSTSTAITEASRVVEIVIPFKTTGRSNIRIYRYHDGKATAFSKRSSRFGSSTYVDGWYYVDTTNEMVYMYTNKFSTYAIGFEEGTVSTSSGGSSGGSSTASASGSVTLPVSGEAGSVSISGEVDGTTVTMDALSSEELQEVLGSDDNNGIVVIDVSGIDDSITGVVIPKETVETIETASADRGSENVLSLVFTNGTLSFDTTALSAITDQAGSDSIQFNLDDIQEDELDSTQQSTVADMNIINTYDAYITCNGVRISDFEGGTVTVAIPFEAETGRDISDYNVYYIPDSGSAEKMDTTYEDNALIFKVTHFSNYVIAYDGTAATSDTTSDTTSTGLTANGRTKYQNGLTINKGFKVIQSGKKLKIKWSKVKGASGYYVYAQYCGSSFTSTPAKTVTSGSVTSVSLKKLNGKKLNLKRHYKVYVVAYKTVDGENQILGRTIAGHIVGSKNTTYSNPKKITLKKTKITLTVGKTTKIKATVTLANSKLKHLEEGHGAKFRYASSNKSIATVTKNGKIKAKKAGTCYIWVYAINGYAKKVKVTVK